MNGDMELGCVLGISIHDIVRLIMSDKEYVEYNVEFANIRFGYSQEAIVSILMRGESLGIMTTQYEGMVLLSVKKDVFLSFFNSDNLRKFSVYQYSNSFN